MSEQKTKGDALLPAFRDVPVTVTVSVGHATPSVEELLALSEESVFTLDRGMEDPVDLYVGDHLIGRGVLEEVGDAGTGRLGVRITDIAPLRDVL